MKLKVKNKRFELRLSEQELNALNKMAELSEIDRSKLVAAWIRRAAKRKGVWA